MSGKTIVVADDDEEITLIAREILENAGYRVHTAVNGTDAAKRIEEIKPDLVLLDILMPEMPGYDVCSYVKYQLGLKNTKILMFSALSSEPAKEWAQTVGADGYLAKPFMPQDLLDAVGRLVGVENGAARKSD